MTCLLSSDAPSWVIDLPEMSLALLKPELSSDCSLPSTVPEVGMSPTWRMNSASANLLMSTEALAVVLLSCCGLAAPVTVIRSDGCDDMDGVPWFEKKSPHPNPSPPKRGPGGQDKDPPTPLPKQGRGEKEGSAGGEADERRQRRGRIGQRHLVAQPGLPCDPRDEAPDALVAQEGDMLGVGDLDLLPVADQVVL